MGCNRYDFTSSRRDFLLRYAYGFGGIALGQLSASSNPLASRPPHFRAKAKQVILIFMQGGPSHVDTFDPKPLLNRLDGQPVPESFRSPSLDTQNLKVAETKLMGSRRTFHNRGESGVAISDLFDNLAIHADNLAVIRSCYHDSFIHGPALNLLYNGSIRVGHPSVGAWVLYGLGSECDNLPAFMIMSDGGIGGRSRGAFSAGFLPAIYQGTLLRTEGSPLINLSPQPEITAADQRVMLKQVADWDNQYRQGREDDTRLDAQIANYELAFRMQTAAPELVDISGEGDSTRKLYGMDEKTTEKFGRICLLARRMVERGVRFIQVISTDWDGHGECDKNHVENARKIDKPIAGLITDLKQRGLLESTLIVCVGEFGRTPVMQGVNGRDHHPFGFSAWLAGGGIKGGKVIGSTDELGFRAVEDKVHVHDLHGTMLALLGLDHKKLTYQFQGRDFRLTDVGGEKNLASQLLA
jgi:uncharacterized protein DUF1501